ncbi:MAG: PadR family transcriptional regulator [Longimicrobiales bacterium]
MPAKSTVELVQGTLDILVLKTLGWGPLHGYGMARWIQQVTDDALCLEEGTLYPALYRLENKRLIEAQWGTTENNRRAKYYRLTPAGRKQLAVETAAWSRLVAVMGKVLSAPKPQVS